MKKLKQIEIFGYALGDLGINFNFQAIGFLLSFYYTDIFGISPAHVAGLYLVARIWDALNDPIMGYIADHTKTKLGQFRPYILFGAIPLNLILLACLYTPDISETGRVIYAYITYISHGMLFTLVGLPYSSLSAVMTQNQQERAVIGAYRMFFACVVAQGVVTLGIPSLVRNFEVKHEITHPYKNAYVAMGQESSYLELMNEIGINTKFATNSDSLANTMDQVKFEVTKIKQDSLLEVMTSRKADLAKATEQLMDANLDGKALSKTIKQIKKELKKIRVDSLSFATILINGSPLPVNNTKTETESSAIKQGGIVNERLDQPMLESKFAMPEDDQDQRYKIMNHLIYQYKRYERIKTQKSYFKAAVFLGIGSILLLWIAFFASKERVQIVSEKYKFKDMFRIIRKNDALLSLSVAMLLNTGVWVTGNAVAFYYFRYILGNETFSDQFFTMAVICNFLGAILAPQLTKRFGKRIVFMGGSLVVVATGISRYFVPPTALGMIIGVSAVFTVGQMMCSITQWGMLPDTVEYGHWKTGQRSEGMPFAIFSFMQKAGMALAGSAATGIMALTGYVANTDLTPRASEGILWLFNFVPAFYSGLCFIALLFYKINGTFYDKIMADLQNGITEASA